MINGKIIRNIENNSEDYSVCLCLCVSSCSERYTLIGRSLFLCTIVRLQLIFSLSCDSRRPRQEYFTAVPLFYAKTSLNACREQKQESGSVFARLVNTCAPPLSRCAAKVLSRRCYIIFVYLSMSWAQSGLCNFTRWYECVTCPDPLSPLIYHPRVYFLGAHSVIRLIPVKTLVSDCLMMDSVCFKRHSEARLVQMLTVFYIV